MKSFGRSPKRNAGYAICMSLPKTYPFQKKRIIILSSSNKTVWCTPQLPSICTKKFFSDVRSVYIRCILFIQNQCDITRALSCVQCMLRKQFSANKESFFRKVSPSHKLVALGVLYLLRVSLPNCLHFSFGGISNTSCFAITYGYSSSPSIYIFVFI